jgi:hypothetical protein
MVHRDMLSRKKAEADLYSLQEIVVKKIKKALG